MSLFDLKDDPIFGVSLEDFGGDNEVGTLSDNPEPDAGLVDETSIVVETPLSKEMPSVADEHNFGVEMYTEEDKKYLTASFESLMKLNDLYNRIKEERGMSRAFAMEAFGLGVETFEQRFKPNMFTTNVTQAFYKPSLEGIGATIWKKIKEIFNWILEKLGIRKKKEKEIKSKEEDLQEKAEVIKDELNTMDSTFKDITKDIQEESIRSGKLLTYIDLDELKEEARRARERENKQKENERLERIEKLWEKYMSILRRSFTGKENPAVLASELFHVLAENRRLQDGTDKFTKEDAKKNERNHR